MRPEVEEEAAVKAYEKMTHENEVAKTMKTTDSKYQTKEKAGLEKPLFLVFHGGSGSTADEIATAVKNGVVKMNIDTDTQWAYWEGLLKFYKAKEGYLQGQIGNPDGEDKPNKSYYDPRKWLRESETGMVKRVCLAFNELGAEATMEKA